MIGTLTRRTDATGKLLGRTGVTGILADHGWPASRLGESLRVLACRKGWKTSLAPTGAPPATLVDEGDDRLAAWLETAAEWLGLEAVPVEVPYTEFSRFLERSGPGLLPLAGSLRTPLPCPPGWQPPSCLPYQTRSGYGHGCAGDDPRGVLRAIGGSTER